MILEQPTPRVWRLQPGQGTTGTSISFQFSPPLPPSAFRSVFISRDPPLERRYLIPFHNNAFFMVFPEEFHYQTLTFEVSVDVPNSWPQEPPQRFVWMARNYLALSPNNSGSEPNISETLVSPPPDSSHQERDEYGSDPFLEAFDHFPEKQDH